MTSKNESLNYIEWLQPDLGYGIWELKVVNVFLRLVWWYIVELSVNVDLFHFMVFSVLCLFMSILHMPLLEAMNINKSSIFNLPPSIQYSEEIDSFCFVVALCPS